MASVSLLKISAYSYDCDCIDCPHQSETCTFISGEGTWNTSGGGGDDEMKNGDEIEDDGVAMADEDGNYKEKDQVQTLGSTTLTFISSS